MREYGSQLVLIPKTRSRTLEFAFSRGGVMAQKTVLLVEDDLEIRDILQDLLEAEGYDVIPASHGKQALEFLAAAPVEDLPQLVVLDMMMPLVDGSQVLASMKSDPKLSPIPVVVLSAVARERPAGAAAFLRKPIPLQKFFDTVRGFVEAGLPRFAS
jgi:CheY-like chemotaxis protein